MSHAKAWWLEVCADTAAAAAAAAKSLYRPPDELSVATLGAYDEGRGPQWSEAFRVALGERCLPDLVVSRAVGSAELLPPPSAPSVLTEAHWVTNLCLSCYPLGRPPPRAGSLPGSQLANLDHISLGQARFCHPGAMAEVDSIANKTYICLCDGSEACLQKS